MLIFDIVLVIVLFILVVSILCGFLSLCERNILSLFHVRIGPSLFLFGLLTPITDGVNLFANYILFVLSFDIFYFIFSCAILVYVMFSMWYLFPVGLIIMLDISISVFILLSFHLVLNIFCVFMVGCFLFTTCFVYIATIRVILFSIISELLLIPTIIIFSILDAFALFTINDLSINQLYINNIFFLGVFFFFIFLFIMSLDGLRLPFDYAESESELVAGIITELSGCFFVVYSLNEINHTILSIVFIIILLFGGFWLSMNVILFTIFFIFVPNAILCSLRITNAYIITIFYVYFLCIFYIIVLVLVNIVVFYL